MVTQARIVLPLISGIFINKDIKEYWEPVQNQIYSIFSQSS